MIGDSIRRRDAAGKVTGAEVYAGDLQRADMLQAVVVFTNQVHARILSLDTARAAQADGVVAVITAADVPVNEYGLIFADQPVLVGPEGPDRGAVAGDVSRWEADHLAVVIAESEDIARAAAGLIETSWEQLPVVADVEAALAPGAPLLHPENDMPTNAYRHLVVRHGDVESAFEAADVIIEGTYDLPYQEHLFLQTEVAVAHVDDNNCITVETAGQWAHEDRAQIAHALDIDAEQVRVIYRAIGGAFGGKEDTSLQIVTALSAKVLAERGIRRPVRAEWTRPESIIGHHKRHRASVTARLAAAADGRLLAIEADAVLDAGAYNSTSDLVVGCLHLSIAGPYEVPAARIDSYAVYTNAVTAGAFRGFGAPQGCFVAEMQMNKLADALGADPVELRRINMYTEGSTGITGTALPSGVHLPEVIDACAHDARWGSPLPRRHPISPFATLAACEASVRRGRGFACGFKNVGFSFGALERSSARLVLHGDAEPSSADLYVSGADLGQGAHTVFVQIAATAAGLPIEAVTGHFSDTATSDDAGSASASRLTFMAGNAILGASEEADKAWRDGARPASGTFQFVAPPTEPLDPDGKPSVPNFNYGYVAQMVDLSVDVETGHIVVHETVCAVDAGRAINRDLVVGQVEGCVVQAHGYALSEHLEVRDGRIEHPYLSTYLIPGVGDVPEQVRSVIVEKPDPLGPFGARGMSEMPLLAYGPAVAAALHDATGVWFDALPLTPERVLAGLDARSESESLRAEAGADSRDPDPMVPLERNRP